MKGALSELPDGWFHRPLKFVASYNDEVLSEKTDPEEEIEYIEISDVSLTEGVKRTSNMEFDGAPSRARRVVRSNDILISTVRTYLKAISNVSDAPHNLIASTGFCVVRPSKKVDPKFLGWVAKSEPFVGEVVSRSVGVSYPAINAGDLVGIDVPVPPIEIQEKIAAFLDEKTAQIDGLIEKKRALLERLSEKRQALITQAVTKGLNPNAPMKDSGIDWLGQVPQHWEVKPLKFLGRFQNGISIGGDSFGSGYPFVSYGDVYNNLSLPKEGSGLVESSKKDRALYSVEGGDVFFTRTSETVEEIAISSVCVETIPDAVFAGFIIRCRPYPDVLDVGFAKYCFRNKSLRSYFVKEMNLVTRASLGQTLLGNLPVALPPMETQKEIATYLDAKFADLEEVETNAENSVRLLSEYRAALISSAVAGKLDGLQ